MRKAGLESLKESWKENAKSDFSESETNVGSSTTASLKKKRKRTVSDHNSEIINAMADSNQVFYYFLKVNW